MGNLADAERFVTEIEKWLNKKTGCDKQAAGEGKSGTAGV
jgi:hypothetical protein